VTDMHIAITGADGFIGKNLRLRLQELGYVNVVSITRNTPDSALISILQKSDFVFHLAGVNRTEDARDFTAGNVELTARVCQILGAAPQAVPLCFASSTQAVMDNPYGRSKRAAELEVESYHQSSGAPVFVFRLPNVFGKWCRPNYNSAVATFCHNLARKIPISVHDADAPLRLVYIDDVIDEFVRLLNPATRNSVATEVQPSYETTVGEVANLLIGFVESRRTQMIGRVGTGLSRALYATYQSYLPPDDFAYHLHVHTDQRGIFAEMLKTADCGQFSFFTAHAGVTRGEHYHHTKTEKFLVIRGTARFSFRHVLSNETYEILTGLDASLVVETVPGWAHNITNIGSDEMIVLLWANEVFDPSRPDTVAALVTSHEAS
jgi:UDP-2-acetamido-2,6-beta-L-arabino-hexul-4-ose reductase